MEEPPGWLSNLREGWGAYQPRLLAMIAPLSPAELELRPAPRLRTVERMASHIIGARIRWFHRVMGEGDAAIAPLAGWDRRGARPRRPDELVRGLDTSWGLISASLTRWKLEDLKQTYEGDPRQGEPPVLTRRWIVWRALEHDLHHGGEISLTLGMHGLTGLKF